MQFVEKLRQKGIPGVLKAVVHRIAAPIGRLQRRLTALRLLKQADYTAAFPHEGGTEIILPRGSAILGLLGLDRDLLISADFMRSAHSEAVVRRTISRLYTAGHIARNRSIIDIGCWRGDNSLAWARCLHETAVVYAIDPSPENLAFARALGTGNAISGVRWIQAACAEVSGKPLGFTGSIEHARFHDARRTSGANVISSTLDEIVGPKNRATIGLIHVDVEGFEERVLRGAAAIIEESRPVIVFEQHLCEDDTVAIADYLATWGYRVFIVNEIIPDCRPDCRNFIAFPADFPVPSDLTNPSPGPRVLDFVPAVPGPDLLRFDPQNRPDPPARRLAEADPESPGEGRDHAELITQGTPT